MAGSSKESARAAAQALISAFSSHDRERYFSSFSVDASFIFHNVPRMLESRAEYEALWAEWEAEGFRVLSCVSEDSEVRMLSDDIALFKHRVTTRLDGVPEPSLERETIVLKRQPDGSWLGVHEHLSPLPTEA